MSAVDTKALETINSPKGGISKAIAYAKNASDETVNMAVSLDASIARDAKVKVSVGATSKVVTLSELADGLAGFDVPARSIVPVVVEPAEKAYYADSLGNGRGRITRVSLGAVDAAHPTATVEHRFVAEDGSTLPPEVTALLPKNRTTIPGIPQVAPSGLSETTVRLTDIQWTFQGWDHTSQAVTGDTVVFTGTWKSGPLTYPVSYRFENTTPDHEFPYSLEYQLPRTSEYPRGETITIAPPRVNVVRDYWENKTWRFQGWEPAVIENIQGPVEVVGRWGYDRDRDVTINYTFVSSDATPLPEEVTKLLPAAQERKAPVSAIGPIDLRSTEVTVPSGVWTFKGWNGGRISWPAGPEHTYTGTWEFARNSYAVTFEYRSADHALTLPDTVTATLPAELSAPHGSEVLLPLPRPARIEVDKGAWVFSGWEPSTIASISEATKVTGTWTYQPTPTFTPVFTFESATEGATLPAEILALLPVGEQYTQGETVVAPAPSQNTLTTPAGTWTFQGWTPDKVEDAQEQVSFVGKWTLDPAMHTVTYVFTSTSDKALSDEVKALLPDAQSLAWGTTLEPDAPASTVLASVEGEWRFNGWNVTKETLVGDLTVTGTWTYHAREFNAKLNFPAELPEAVKKMHDTDATPVIRDGKVCAPPPLKTEVAVEGGTWRFDGWEKECFTLEELSKHLTVNAQPSGAGGGNGAALFALKDIQLVYALPFVPKWTFIKSTDPKQPLPKDPVPPTDGKDKGQSGKGKPGASDQTKIKADKSAPSGKQGLSKTGASGSVPVIAASIVAAGGLLLLLRRRRG